MSKFKNTLPEDIDITDPREPDMPHDLLVWLSDEAIKVSRLKQANKRIVDDFEVDKVEQAWLKKPIHLRQDSDNWAGSPLEQELA